MGNSDITRLQGWGTTVIRVVVGIVFLMHGGQKLFVLGFGGVAAFLGKLGILAPILAGVVVTLVEFLGGLALFLGLFTRWFAVPLAIDMLVAILAIHLPNGFFLPRGFEYALMLLAATVALALLGPGQASADRLWGSESRDLDQTNKPHLEHERPFHLSDSLGGKGLLISC
jgi:putative oxidoreductase